MKKSMFNYRYGLVLFLLPLLFVLSCDKDVVEPSEKVIAQETFLSKGFIPPGQLPGADIEIAPPTIELLEPRVRTRDEGVPMLEPGSLEATLEPGECITESKVATIPASSAPPRGDILFSFDLTGSMGPVIANAKVNATNIMNDVAAVIADAQFGVTTFKDYSGSFSGCGYSATYGGLSDFPYDLNQPMTGIVPSVQAVIDGLTVSGGSDGPESYTRAMFETYNDAALGFRTGAKRIVLIFGDALPHDCSIGTGPDPGPDEVANNEDDLILSEVLNEMAERNITMLALRSSTFSFEDWQGWAQSTGGDAFLIDSETTAEFIVEKILEEVSLVESMSIEVCDPEFSDWLADVSPGNYNDLDLSEENVLDFDLQICVPPDTEPGVYDFEICLVGDGAEFATQSVSITVEGEVPVDESIIQAVGPNGENIDNELQDGDIIDASLWPRFTLEYLPSEPGVGSVVMELSGPRMKTQKENSAGYYLFGNDGSSLNTQIFPAGLYNIKVTSYSGRMGRGDMISTMDIDFEVVQPQVVLEFQMFNETGDLVVSPLSDGDVLVATDLPGSLYNIQAITDPNFVGSVRMEINGPVTYTNVENYNPYFLFSNASDSGRREAMELLPGSYSLTATPYNKKNAAGAAGMPLSISFTVEE